MNQLPDEIILKIFGELRNPQFLIKLSKFFPNRYIFPSLFRIVIVQHIDGLGEQYILKDAHGVHLFRFFLTDFLSVRVVTSDLQNNLDLLGHIKPYILDVQFYFDIEDEDDLHWTNEVEHFLNGATLESLLSVIKLSPTYNYRGLKKLTLYDPDWLISYGTTSITHLTLHDQDTPIQYVILKLTEQAFPSLRELDVTNVWIKVLDFNSPLERLSLKNVTAPYLPSIHKLRRLKVLNFQMVFSLEQHDTLSSHSDDVFQGQKSESLEWLTVTNVKSSSISLLYFPNLKQFESSDFLHGIKTLEDVPETLENLVIYSKELVRVPNFNQSNLLEISITGARIESLENLFSECLNLSIANLAENRIKEIPGIVESPSISSLDLRSNKLNHIENLIFPKLNYLNLQANPLTEIVSLNGCQSLKHLDVSNCKLKDFSFIKNLTELEELYAEDNEINSVQSLVGKIKLKVLLLDRNQLTDITPIETCFDLKVLRVSSNKISKANLVGLKHLTVVDLSENLIYEVKDLNLDESVDRSVMVVIGRAWT